MKLKEGAIYRRKGEKGEDRYWDRVIYVINEESKNLLCSVRRNSNFDMQTPRVCSIQHFKRIMDYENPTT